MSRKQIYVLDTDDILKKGFVNQPNVATLIAGLNLYGASQLRVSIGGTNNNTFDDDKFVVYNAATAKLESSASGPGNVASVSALGDYYTKDEIDASFETPAGGKYEVDWTHIKNKPAANTGLSSLGAGLYFTETSSQTMNVYAASSFFEATHGLGAVPSVVEITALCSTPDLGYAVGDEISVENMHDDTGGADDERPMTSGWRNATKVGLSCMTPVGGYYTTGKAGTRDVMTLANWKIRIRAWK